jgi:short-subunit dehydrogenase
MVVTMTGASQTYRLEYAQSSTSPNANVVLRARRQRITLMHIQ